jgi:hypothetical protein
MLKEVNKENEMQSSAEDKFQRLVGKTVKLRPVQVTGKDGVKYWVLTFLAAGQGWFARQTKVVSGPEVTIDVKVESVSSRSQYVYAEVRIVSGGNAEVLGDFIKAPYKSKATGKYNPSFQPKMEGSAVRFDKQYGVRQPFESETYAAYNRGEIKILDVKMEPWYELKVECSLLGEV